MTVMASCIDTSLITADVAAIAVCAIAMLIWFHARQNLKKLNREVDQNLAQLDTAFRLSAGNAVSTQGDISDTRGRA